MDTDQLRAFADQLDVDSDAVVERWQGRPDRIIDDIFRVTDIDTGQPRDLELFDVQRELVHAYFYSDEGTLNAYKGRRIGYSFAVIVCFLLEGLFYPNSYYPIVSRSLTQSKARISDLEDLIENAKINIPTEKQNTDYIELWNGTAFEAYSSDSDTSRGRDSARSVLMDEMAFLEKEEEAHRAFSAFLALGEDRKMVEISTPNTKNDLFMQTHRRGSRGGSDGVVSIKQPTFANADDIDVNTSLYEQKLKPVRPEINIDQLEVVTALVSGLEDAHTREIVIIGDFRVSQDEARLAPRVFIVGTVVIRRRREVTQRRCCAHDRRRAGMHPSERLVVEVYSVVVLAGRRAVAIAGGLLSSLPSDVCERHCTPQ